MKIQYPGIAEIIEADLVNLRRMAELWAGSDEVAIPGVIDAASNRRVLTIEYVAG